MNAEMIKAVHTFYEVYAEFYKKSGDSNTAIRPTCAICGIDIPESNSFSFMFWQEGGKRNGRKR